MRIKCPSCGAEGRVPDQEGTRTVRCPQCEHLWEVRGGEEGGAGGTGEADGERTPPTARTAHERGAPRGDFRVTRVISTALSVWLRNLLPFGTIALVGYLPVLLYVLYLLGQGAETTKDVETRFSNVLSFFSTQFIAASVIAGVFQVLRDGKVEVGRSLGVGLRRVAPAMGIAFLMGVCLGLVAIPAVVLAFQIGAEEIDPCAGSIGLLVCAIPLGYVYVGLCLAIPATVVEGLGVNKSLSRSWRLTAGVRWRILVALALLFVLLSFGVGIGGMVLELARVEVQIVAHQVMTILGLSLQGVLICVGYHQLRVAREGIASEELAAIFD